MGGKLEGLEAVHEGGQCLALIRHNHVWVQVLSNIQMTGIYLSNIYPKVCTLVSSLYKATRLLLLRICGPAPSFAARQ
jgi:hypothetical protein